MIDEVLASMQRAAETAILPRFRSLKAHEISEKSPGEVVTHADEEAERLIFETLHRLRPDALLVGEEATAKDPALLEAVGQADAVWLVDPLDGTRNFVAGTEDFAVMVALVEGAETVAAWIWIPLRSKAWTAQRGAGAQRNGALFRQARRDSSQRPRGVFHTGYMDAGLKQQVDESGAQLADLLPNPNCAGVEYPNIALGRQDLGLFRRTLPWDHAPGALILQEAGGIARHWNGRDFMPGAESEGVIIATDPDVWQLAASTLPEELRQDGAGTDSDRLA